MQADLKAAPDRLNHVDRDDWQVAEVQAALAEADAGDFAAATDVAALARKWAPAMPDTKSPRFSKLKVTAVGKPTRKRTLGIRGSDGGR